MNISDLNDLDFENVGAWPPLAKGLAVLAVAIVILAAGYFLSIKDQRASLERQKQEEARLFAEFEEKQKKAANLDAYRDQLDEIEVILQSLLRQLPSKTEMPDLLVDVSQTALSSGIDAELFNPGPEVVREFYAEKPIALRMIGSYHQFGQFVSGVASLPRVVILTMHDISLRPRAGSSTELVLEGTAKTYRYVDEGETVEENNG
ncbi:MAG: fimbrial protein [Lysobacteraceae bacterium]|nr:MAG: fimbrial protein [Xanthomonadaceae bacterium]